MYISTGSIALSRSPGGPDCSEWDQDHLRATLIKAEGGAVVFPKGWGAFESLADWPGTSSLIGPVAAQLARLREHPTTRGDYRLRQAHLSHALVSNPRWAPGTRLGACYASIVVGMAEHEFLLDSHNMLAVALSHYPERVIGLDSTWQSLYALLFRAYAGPNVDRALASG